MKNSMNNIDNKNLFEQLSSLSRAAGVTVVAAVPFQSNAKGLLCGDTIGLSDKLSLEETNYTLAHELAHHFLHFDKGDTIRSEKHGEYEEQADRAAKMLLKALAIGQKGETNESY